MKEIIQADKIKFEDKNFYIINKTEYDDILKDNKEDIYLYHFIFAKYIDNNVIKYTKIDDSKDLKMLESKKILIKYYIEKIHYYNDCNNDNFEYGEPYYIFNIGHFYIGGFIKNKDIEIKKVKDLFKKYTNSFPTMIFPFSDKEYLSLNK